MDNVDFLPPDHGRIRFINAAQHTGNLYVVQAATNAVLIDNLQPGTSSVHKHLAAGPRTYTFMAAGGGAVATLNNLNVAAGVVYTVVVVGDAAQNAAQGANRPGGVEFLIWKHSP